MWSCSFRLFSPYIFPFIKSWEFPAICHTNHIHKRWGLPWAPMVNFPKRHGPVSSGQVTCIPFISPAYMAMTFGALIVSHVYLYSYDRAAWMRWISAPKHRPVKNPLKKAMDHQGCSKMFHIQSGGDMVIWYDCCPLNLGYLGCTFKQVFGSQDPDFCGHIKGPTDGDGFWMRCRLEKTDHDFSWFHYGGWTKLQFIAYLGGWSRPASWCSWGFWTNFAIASQKSGEFPRWRSCDTSVSISGPAPKCTTWRRSCSPSLRLDDDGVGTFSNWRAVPPCTLSRLSHIYIYPLVIFHSYWKLSFIVDLPIENGDFQ